MKWNETTPDNVVLPARDFLRSLDWATSLAYLRNRALGRSVYIHGDCRREVSAHLNSGRGELGGLLVGKVYSAPLARDGAYNWITIIEKSIPSKEFDSSSVSLRMETEVWGRARAYLEEGRMIVGWYHSHPNLGVFFSGTDRRTQAAFFRSPYSLGLVIDPIRKEEKCFVGPDSDELLERILTIEAA